MSDYNDPFEHVGESPVFDWNEAARLALAEKAAAGHGRACRRFADGHYECPAPHEEIPPRGQERGISGPLPFAPPIPPPTTTRGEQSAETNESEGSK